MCTEHAGTVTAVRRSAAVGTGCFHLPHINLWNNRAFHGSSALPSQTTPSGHKAPAAPAWKQEALDRTAFAAGTRGTTAKAPLGPERTALQSVCPSNAPPSAQLANLPPPPAFHTTMWRSRAKGRGLRGCETGGEGASCQGEPPAALSQRLVLCSGACPALRARDGRGTSGGPGMGLGLAALDVIFGLVTQSVSRVPLLSDSRDIPCTYPRHDRAC